MFIERMNKMSMDFYSKIFEDHKKIESELQKKDHQISEMQIEYTKMAEEMCQMKQKNLKFNEYIKKVRQKLKEKNLQDDNLDMTALEMDDSMLISYLNKQAQSQMPSFAEDQTFKNITFKKDSQASALMKNSKAFKNLSSVDLGEFGNEKEFYTKGIKNILENLEDK